MFLREQYSRTKTRDLRGAMAEALKTYLAGISIPVEAGVVKFAKVFSEWPDYDDKFITPSAVVLPSSAPYVAARLTPSLIEETWEPKGFQGFGLYALAEIDAEFEIKIRTTDKPTRSAIMSKLEELWVFPGYDMGDPYGLRPDGQYQSPIDRYGVLLPMPDYYGLSARFALASQRVVDDQDPAMRNIREATITVTGQGRLVELLPVVPMIARIREYILGADGTITEVT